MGIYSNFPGRLTQPELVVDIPCREATFSSLHPFVDDSTIFAPRRTLHEVYALLFQNPDLGLLASELTIFHAFLLIHCECSPTTPIRLRLTWLSCTSALRECTRLHKDTACMSPILQLGERSWCFTTCNTLGRGTSEALDARTLFVGETLEDHPVKYVAAGSSLPPHLREGAQLLAGHSGTPRASRRS